MKWPVVLACTLVCACGRRTPPKAPSERALFRDLERQVTVKATYHQDLVIPLVSALLPKDAGGRMTLIGEVTMVIN